jgi:hypothetical protein
MLLDALLAFVPLGAPLSLVGGAGISIPSTLTLDLLGQGVGTAPTNIIGTATTFGTDFGIGDDRALLECVVGAALTTADGCTLNVAMQAAPDQGAGGSYQPGAWQTLVETGPLTAAQCPANTRVARFDWPPAFPENLQPRYMRLLFQVPSGLNFTGGTIAWAIPTLTRDDQSNRYAAKNYSVS